MGDFPSEKVRAKWYLPSEIFYWFQESGGGFVEELLCVREDYYHMNVSPRNFLSGQKILSPLYLLGYLAATFWIKPEEIYR